LRVKRVPLNKKDRSDCHCARCPTYSNCNSKKGELLFCLDGKTKCEVDNQGCICAACPVFIKYELQNEFYCIEGSEKEREQQSG
jgi:hypothetical protein